MSRALWSAGRLKPEIRLAQALSEFEAFLPPNEKARLRASNSQFRSNPPRTDDVMRFTAEVDVQAKRRLGSGRCFGPRFTYILQTVQQFAALGDILVGGSQNLIVCGVWSVIRMTILAMTASSSSMERLSLLFMTAGRSSPRYQGLALLYSRSHRIQDFLAEYMIVIVQICHQFLTFSQKSTLGQITSSLSDSKIRSAEEDLGRWAQLIKDEASFLLSETTEREATENTNFRRWVAVLNDSDFRQRKIDKGLQWLSAISTYDYETPWKQARKRGSSSCFMDIASYKQWKDRQGPSSLILSGTMGSGKSVIMASMIDDLNLSCLNDTILYFFCRHDIPESLKARTVFGSLARQLLQHHIDADTMDDIFADFIPLIGLEKVLDILLIAIRRLKGVRLVLDGIDECKEEEIQLIHQGLSQLQETGDMMSCVSFRTQADGLQPRFQYAKESMSISVPDDNPDIREFIELELQRHKESGRLSLGDPILLLTIRDALLSGANGMFLWVSLQIDSICAEKTDYSIRQALEDMPKDLGGTFRRILQQSKDGGRCYQRDIMKILVGANRPLTAAEFREALSVVPGDISWDPGKLINNIYSTVACCGSLVIIDEEERTFRLVHQSVAQFLLAKTAESLEWSFSAKEANSHMGDITVTYLNYGVFDQRVSTAVIPRMYAGETPERIVSQALEPYGIIGKVAMSLLKTQHAANHDIGKTLSKAGNLRQGPKATAETYDLLGYSSTNWLIHTGDISDESSMFPLWRYLLSHPRFGKLPWDTNEESSNAFTVDEGSGIIWGLHPQVRWAISHSHLPLFLTEIRSRSGMKALCSVCPYLTGLMHTNPNIKLASHICDKLLLISTFFQAGEPTDWLLRMHNYSIEQYLMLLRKQENWEYSIFRWAIVRDPFQGLHDSSEPLVEEAVRHSDARTVKILLDRGARLDIHLHEAPLRTAVRSCFSNPENLPMVADMLEVATWADVALVHESDIFVYLHVYTNHSDVFSIDQKLFWGGDGPPHLVMEKFLRRACRRGDYKLIKALMSSVELDAVHHSNLLCEALFARSSERTRIVRLLLDSQATHSSLPFASLSVALSRSIQLRDWDSAKTLARAMGLGLATSRAFSTDLRIVYMCIDIRDTAGLGFLLEYTTPSLHQVTLCPEMVCYDDLRSVTPVTYTLNSTWDTTEDCYELLKVAKHLLRCTYSGPPATNDLTEPYAHLESALKFGASMLRTLFISAAVPRGYSSLGLRDHHDQGVNLSHEPDPDALIEVSAFTESIRVRSSALCLLDELLRQLPGPGSYRATLLETLQCVLESYHTATTLLHMFHGADVEQAGVPPAVDKVNELKLGLVRIAETLLNKCDASRMKGELKMCFQISPYFAKYRHMRHWHLQGIMEYILRAHGVVIGEFGVGIPQVDPPQEFYLPLQVEALALGHPFQHIISKARNRVPEPVDRWSSMVEAYLIRTATEFREDGRMRNVIKMWRDAAGFDEQEVELVKASSPVSIMISGGAVVG